MVIKNRLPGRRLVVQPLGGLGVEQKILVHKIFHGITSGFGLRWYHTPREGFWQYGMGTAALYIFRFHKLPGRDRITEILQIQAVGDGWKRIF